MRSMMASVGTGRADDRNQEADRSQNISEKIEGLVELQPVWQ
jgi:hypothetical protein